MTSKTILHTILKPIVRSCTLYTNQNTKMTHRVARKNLGMSQYVICQWIVVFPPLDIALAPYSRLFPSVDLPIMHGSLQSALIVPLRDDTISIRAGIYISKVTRQNQKRGFDLPEAPFAGVPVSRSLSASTDSKGTGRRYTHVRLQLVGYTAPTTSIDAVADGTKETVSDCTCVFVSTLSPPFICQTKPTEATLRSATPVVNRTFVSPLDLPRTYPL
jgi:hypothetical protein